MPLLPDYQGGEMLCQTNRCWSSVSASLAEIRCDRSMRIGLGADCTQLSILLEEVGGRTSMRIEPAPCGVEPLRKPLPLSLIPPGSRAQGEARGVRYLRHLVLRFDGPTLADMLEEPVDLDAILVPRAMFACTRLLGLAKLFAEECEGPDQANLLYGDGLSVALLQGLGSLARPAMGAAPNGRLAPWQLRRAVECIQDNLAEAIPLQQLAAATRLSVSYFCRAFKASTGLPPHQWQLLSRIEKVKELLLDGRDSIAQIALTVGFADQAHMTRTFSRVVGTSPGAWQRQRQPVVAGSPPGGIRQTPLPAAGG
jgi:AraC family transcriptional regulator